MDEETHPKIHTQTIASLNLNNLSNKSGDVSEPTDEMKNKKLAKSWGSGLVLWGLIYIYSCWFNPYLRGCKPYLHCSWFLGSKGFHYLGKLLSSWWLNQPEPTHLKNMRKSNWIISPSRGAHSCWWIEKYIPHLEYISKQTSVIDWTFAILVAIGCIVLDLV